ncbi:MAG TPA: GDSL-type esterase/lipase family protein [Polyangiaceae bacterium]|nr:GDSL-type esterase/lipase family protein [Polyangiaceae bacterium]
MSLNEWRGRHAAQLVDPVRSQAKVVFVGDSITQGWAESPAYLAEFGRYHPLCLGIGGDQTQHVLWRLADGALAGVPARVVVILIGVNNLGNGHSPEQTFRGVRAVVRRVERDLPAASLLLLCILPAGEAPSDPLREQIQLTNRRLPALGSQRVTVLDVGGVFLDADERITPELMADFLHPTALGYTRLTRAVAPELARRLAAAAR